MQTIEHHQPPPDGFYRLTNGKLRAHRGQGKTRYNLTDRQWQILARKREQISKPENCLRDHLIAADGRCARSARCPLA